MSTASLYDVIEKIEKVQPGKYIYVGLFKKASRQHILAVCSKHGRFTSTPSHMYNGSGCKACGVEKSAEGRADTFDEAVAKSRLIHGDKYEYIGLETFADRRAIRFSCPTHGETVKTLNAHINRKQGCPDCGALEGVAKRTAGHPNYVQKPKKQESSRTLAELEPKFRLVHGDLYNYLSLTYLGRTTSVTYTCKEHGEHTQNIYSHLKGQGCPACGVARRKASRTDSFETVVGKAQAVHGDRYEYVSMERVGPRSMVKAICKEHGEFTILSSLLLLGKGCQTCGFSDRSEKLRTPLVTYEAKAREVHGDKYTYKSQDWVDYVGYITYDCAVHGEHRQSMSNHLNGAGCPECAYLVIGDKVRYNLEEFIPLARRVHGDKYQYEAITMVGPDSAIEFICEKHGKVVASTYVHLNGAKCKRCANEERGFNSRDTLESFIPKAEKLHGNKYLYLSLDFSPSASRVNYLCPTHGLINQSSAGHISENGCPRCTNRVSRQNNELADFLTSLGLEIKLEHRFPNSRKFIDLTIPSHNLAIEYNGNYWHSSEYLTTDYHKEKTKLANDNGYEMLHIWSHEWRDSREKLEAIIRQATGKTLSTVSAELTEVYTPTKQEAESFMSANHLQGATSSGTYIALKNQDELVAVMCFNHNPSTNQAELTRYSTNTSVAGGFTKLLNHYLKENPQIQSVVSYSDNRVFTDSVYEAAGFAKMHTTKPDYQYLERGDLPPKHKANYQKSKLIKRFGEEACRGKTERQITEENNIYRIYDCGLTKWLYTRV